MLDTKGMNTFNARPVHHSTEPNIIVSPPGPRAREILEREARYVSPSLTKAYPLVVDHAKGTYVFDVDGNTFLDFTTGIAVTNLGHCHDRINAAIHDQVERLLHMSNADFTHPEYSELCERLALLAPGNTPKKVFLSNSGTEAVECAVKLAHHYFHGQRPHSLAFYGAFHGRTSGSLAYTASSPRQRQWFKVIPGVEHIPYPNTYHSEDVDHLDKLATTLFREKDPRLFSSVIMEPIQGEGGYLVPPSWYVQKLKRLCEEHGILFIADEVQTGMGRTGKMFCVEHYGVEPDIITLAKGIANGLPLGATIGKAEIMDSWGPGAHASTFGGNPVSDRAALAVIDELTKGGVLENCQTMGIYLQTELKSLLRKHPSIGDVRGMGLMIGVEFVSNRATRQQAPKYRDAVVRRCFESGLLLLGCGASAIRVIPPLTITKEEIDAGLAILDRVLRETEEHFQIRTPQWGTLEIPPLPLGED